METVRVIVFSFLLPTKKTVKHTKAAIAKKTDAITPDDKPAKSGKSTAVADFKPAGTSTASTIPAAVAETTHADETAGVSAKGVRARSSAAAKKSDDE